MNTKIFFDLYKSSLDKDHKLTQDEVNSLNILLTEYEKHKDLFILEQWAYIFGTIFHETNGTMKPVKEAYWLSEEWRKNNLKYYPYYGRDYAHTTWLVNFKKFSTITGIDLAKYPERISEIPVALTVLVCGFTHGIWTGKKISDYVNVTKKDYLGARKCINGTDKAALVASYAKLFEGILIAANKV